MTVLQQAEGLVLLALFGVLMIALVWFRTKAERHADGFLVADREVGAAQGAFSIAISWVWAPAIFVCSMQAYNLGLPGIFWFTLPNIICFFVFAPIAIRLRRQMPEGYTLPEYIWHRFGQKRYVHLIFVTGFILNMIGAIVANAFAGGALLNAMSGVEIHTAIISMGGMAIFSIPGSRSVWEFP